MILEAFLYIWYDSIEKMFYLGWHKGTAYDNYGQSSSVLMEGYKGNKPWKLYSDAPPHFKRRILAWGTSLEMMQLENKLLMSRKVRFNPKYYNKSYGSPTVADQNGEFNCNYQDKGFSNRHNDSELYAKLDHEGYQKRHSDPNKRARDCARMSFNDEKRKGNKEKARKHWNDWYKYSLFKSKNRRNDLWESDTFEMWYYREGSELNFRDRWLVDA